MTPYRTCVYTIRNKKQLDDAAEMGTRFAFEINMRWVGAVKEFEKAKRAGEDYIALIADAAQTDTINHIGLIDSINISKTTRIEFSQIMKIENEIWKTDLVKMTGDNISEDFIRAYCLCKTPDFSSFPKLKRAKHTAMGDKQEYYAMEGAISERITKYRSRDRKLVRMKINQSVKDHGNLNCEICGFSFEDVYGLAGKDFCEVHHIRVISENNDSDSVTTLDDLAILCSNCHRIIHRKVPAYTVAEVKNIISRSIKCTTRQCSETRPAVAS